MNATMPKAIILAAGEGTRLRPYTLERPKCLVEVDGRSLLDRQVDVLHVEGVESIVVVGGYMAGTLARPGIELRINPRYADTNMVWTAFCVEQELVGDVVLAYGDIVYSRQVLQALLQSTADIAVTIDLDWEGYWRARNDDPLLDAETLKLAADGRILELGKKPTGLADIQGQYMGLMKFTDTGTAVLKRVFNEGREGGVLGGKTVEKAYMTDLLQAVIDAGYSIYSVPVHGGWVEVDTVSDLHAAITKSRLATIAQL
jgi:L-glutamine-phosphate cytidylyltransferase